METCSGGDRHVGNKLHTSGAKNAKNTLSKGQRGRNKGLQRGLLGGSTRGKSGN